MHRRVVLADTHMAVRCGRRWHRRYLRNGPWHSQRYHRHRHRRHTLSQHRLARGVRQHSPAGCTRVGNRRRHCNQHRGNPTLDRRDLTQLLLHQRHPKSRPNLKRRIVEIVIRGVQRLCIGTLHTIAHQYETRRLGGYRMREIFQE